MSSLRVCILLVVTVATCAMTGCSTLSTATADSFGLLFGNDRNAITPTAAEVAARPYYQLEFDAGDRSALLILGNIDHGRQAWYDANNLIVFLRHGVLVKIRGMQPGIIATRLPANSPFVSGLEKIDGPTTATRRLDLPDYRYGVKATSTLVPDGLHEVTILGQAHRVLLVEERIQAPAIDFAATNRYWVDPADGFIWKSRQTIPGGATVTLTQLRPYRGEQP